MTEYYIIHNIINNYGKEKKTIVQKHFKIILFPSQDKQI